MAFDMRFGALDEEALPTVVVGVDDPASAPRLARWAAREAAARRVPLTVLHVPHLTGPRMDSRDEVERDPVEAAVRAARAEYPRLRVRTEFGDVPPARALGRASLNAALIVIGTRGRGALTGFLPGSVGRQLAADAHCPVMLVHGEPSAVSPDEVVVAIGPDTSTATVRYAFAEAERYGAVLRAVRAHPPNTATDPARIERLLAPFRTAFPGVTVKVTLISGGVVPCLTETLRGTSVLIVGAHRRRRLRAAGGGHVTRTLIANPPAPVTVVPAA